MSTVDFKNYKPDPKHKFTFGLWTVGNIGRDPFGGPVREPISAGQICDLLGKAGAYGVNFHDNDLIPIDATPAEADRIKAEFRKGLAANNLKVPMATTNLFGDAAFKDGAFTSNNAKRAGLRHSEDDAGDGPGARVRGQDVRVLGRPGGCRDRRRAGPDGCGQAVPRGDEFPGRVQRISQGYGYRFAFEAKPNEPRGHIYFAVTGSVPRFHTHAGQARTCSA